MIIEAICNLIALVLLGIISLFPTIPVINFDFLNGVIRVFSLIDMFVSLRIVSLCLVAILVVWNARIVWAAIMWVVRKIPFIQ